MLEIVLTIISQTGCITSNGETLTWGFGDSGALGHGEDVVSNQYTPRIISSLKNYQMKHISCGKNHSVTLTTSGETYITGFGKNITRKLTKNRRIISIGCDSNGDRTTCVTSDGIVLLFNGDEKQKPIEISMVDGLAIKAEPSIQNIMVQIYSTRNKRNSFLKIFFFSKQNIKLDSHR